MQAETDLGEVLTTADGMTVYGFTNDGRHVELRGRLRRGVAPGHRRQRRGPGRAGRRRVRVTERSDGTFQLVAGDWPLYTFAGDEAAGDVNGQGSGGVWFAVAPDGELNSEATPPAAAAGNPTRTTYDY